MIGSLVIGLVLGAGFLALALWGVPMDDLGRALAQMRWSYLVHLAVAFALQYGLRAWRQLVLVRPLAPATTFRTQLSITMVGFFCVNTFPVRLGEAVRPYLLYERDGVPLGAGFGLVFVERVMDLVALFAVLIAVVLMADVPDRSFELMGRSFSLAELGRLTAFAVLVPALAIVLGMAVLGRTAVRIGERVADSFEARFGPKSLPSRLARFATRFATSFVEAVHSLRSPARLAAAVLLTTGLFLAMGLQMWFLSVAFELDDQIGFGAGLGVLAITMLGIALPAPPGFAGVFEAAARGGLALFGVSGEALAGRALAFALVMHWWPFLLLAASGGFFLWRDRIGFGRLFRFARGGASSPG